MWSKFRSWPTAAQVGVWIVLGIVVLSVIGAAVGDSETSSSGSTADTSQAAAPESAAPDSASKSNVATDDYTPHVGQGTPVAVDELTWRVRGTASSSTSLGDNEFANATANGIFVVVPMTVKNNKSKTVTVNSSMVKLVAGGKEYETDSEGEFALLGSGQKSFFLEDVGPDLSQDGTVVFDVPPAALRAKPEICIGELGFGPSRGCIALTHIS